MVSLIRGGSLSYYRYRWLPCLVSVLTVLSTTGCVSIGTALRSPARAGTGDGVPEDSLPGIPNRSQLVTVVPMCCTTSVSPMQNLYVVIPAVVDGFHGLFLLDTGEPDTELYRDFLQRNSHNGVDSVTDNSLAPHRRAQRVEDSVWVKLRLGTLVDSFTQLYTAGPPVRPINAFLANDFLWGWQGTTPLLGTLGLPALGPFETIIDYTRRRVVFVRVDSTGQRLIDVPAYRPRGYVPLVQIRSTGGHWGIEVQEGTLTDTLLIDTGVPDDGDGDRDVARRLQHVLGTGQGPFAIDTTKEMTEHELPGRSRPLRIIGFGFLHQLGVVGFNFRTRQLILYQPPV